MGITDILMHPAVEKFLLMCCNAAVCALGSHFHANAIALAGTKTPCYALVFWANTCAFDCTGMRVLDVYRSVLSLALSVLFASLACTLHFVV